MRPSPNSPRKQIVVFVDNDGRPEAYWRIVYPQADYVVYRPIPTRVVVRLAAPRQQPQLHSLFLQVVMTVLQAFFGN